MFIIDPPATAGGTDHTQVHRKRVYHSLHEATVPIFVCERGIQQEGQKRRAQSGPTAAAGPNFAPLGGNAIWYWSSLDFNAEGVR